MTTLLKPNFLTVSASSVDWTKKGIFLFKAFAANSFAGAGGASVGAGGSRGMRGNGGKTCYFEI